MQKICEQHDVVGAAPGDFEGTAWRESIALGNTEATSIFHRDRQHVCPIECRDVRLAILTRDRDAEHSVPRRHVEHAERLPGISAHKASEQLGRHLHHRTHRASELNPDRVVVRDGSLVGNGRASFPHGRGQFLKALLDRGLEHETQRAAQIGRRLAIEKHLGVGGEIVAFAVLLEEAEDGEIVCQNTDATRRGAARSG